MLRVITFRDTIEVEDRVSEILFSNPADLAPPKATWDDISTCFMVGSSWRIRGVNFTVSKMCDFRRTITLVCNNNTSCIIDLSRDVLRRISNSFFRWETATGTTDVVRY
mgnify:CR=1 FL=1